MNLSIDSYLAYFRYDPEGFQRLIDRLQTLGYQPLVRKAAQSFSDIFGGKAEWRTDLLDNDDNEESQHLSELNRRRLLSLEKLGYGWGIGGIRGLAKVPGLKGELFNSLDGQNMLFLSVLEFDKSGEHSAEDHPTAALRAGLVGDMNAGAAELNNFLTTIAEFLFENGSDIEWEQDQVESQQYREFMAAQGKAGFSFANTIATGDLQAARELENQDTREVAQLVRKYGTILAKDLVSQSANKGIDARHSIDRLAEANLLRQEYIVVCSKTGNHVNRAESREMIKQMGKLGLLCSCGEHISDELIEGVVSSDAMLLRLLEKSNWLTAAIVRVLTSLGVPAERVILNPSLNGEDAEVLTDIGGSLMMFGLQDNEFALPQALNFGSRIAMHRPQLAFVVAGRGITNEAKDHFKRLKNDTQLVYVSNIEELEPTVKDVVDGIRLNRVRAMFGALQSMVNFNITPLISSKFGSAPRIAHTVSTSEKPAPIPAPQAAKPATPANTEQMRTPIVTPAPVQQAAPAPQSTPVVTPAPVQQAAPAAHSSPIVTPAPAQHSAPATHSTPIVTPPPPPVQQSAPSAPIVTPAPQPHTAPAATAMPSAPASVQHVAPSPAPSVQHTVPTHSVPVRTVQIADDFDSEPTHSLPVVSEEVRMPKAKPAPVEHVEAPIAHVEPEIVAEEMAPQEIAPQRTVFAMPGPVAEVETVHAKANSIDTSDTLDSLANAIAADRAHTAPAAQPAPASVTIFEEAPQVSPQPIPQPAHHAPAPEPQVYAMPGPVAREVAPSFEVPHVEPQSPTYFEGQAATDSAPQGQDAWDSLSSILANAAEKAGAPAPAQGEHHSLAESLPAMPRPNGGLKLSLFGGHDDDDNDFEHGAHHTGEHHVTEEQEEERRNKAAAIRGLRNSS